MKLLKRLIRWRFGEAALWVLFAGAYFSAAADSYGGEKQTLLAAVAALAAIGVRATREPKNEPEE